MRPVYRRRPSKLLGGRFRNTPIISDILHVDESGIYALIAKNVESKRRFGIGRYSFDYKCSAEHWHNDDTEIIDLIASQLVVGGHSHNYLVYASHSEIYSTEDSGDFKSMYTTDGIIQDLIYHPYRDSYLIACEDGVMELDSEFRLTPRDITVFDPWNILPSQRSTMLYMTWHWHRDSYFSIYDVIGNRQSSIDFEIGPRTLYILLERPEHPEILSLIGNDFVMIDLWHTQSRIIRYNFPAACHAVYIDSNTCICAMEKNFHIVDHRYGIVQNISGEHDVYNMWFANSQLFVKTTDTVFVIDM